MSPLGLAGWSEVDASLTWHTYTCAARIDHTLWCWGHNQYGQLGQGDHKLRSVPAQVGTDSSWGRVSVGAGQTCATQIDASLWCWGGNLFGQLGLGGSHRQPTPTQVGEDASWTPVEAGGAHTCAQNTPHTLVLGTELHRSARARRPRR